MPSARGQAAEDIASLAANSAKGHVGAVIETGFHTLADGRRIAFRHVGGAGPAVVFLPGYLSDMAGSKATALIDWAAANGRACLLFDYSGCGESPGDFADGTLSRWSEEAIALIGALTTGPIVLVGSSMGGWLMLLVARELGARLAGLVGIAAAPDFTDWGYDDEQKARLVRGETLLLDNPYGPDPTPVHPGFWADGQAQRQLGGKIPIACPVRLLHGQEDGNVPSDISLKLAAALRSQDVQVTLVKGGDHRLSREQEIALLLRTVGSLTGAA
jgi:pimeloyl-ACP methyl ester carboxylesterase